jgi:ribosomal-protein-alanine N-acetyltransferase
MPPRIEPMTPEWAKLVVTWRHPPPYDTYDVTVEECENLLNPAYRYHAVLEDGELIGYCCFGDDAQVRGGTYREGELEVGWGMRPDLMGQGRGREFAAAILDYAERTYRPKALGLTIAEFNGRSQAVAERHVFTLDGPRFAGPDGMVFRRYLRPITAT